MASFIASGIVPALASGNAALDLAVSLNSSVVGLIIALG